MKVRFLADANFDRKIVEGVCRREPDVDFLSAHDAGLQGQEDLKVLEIAASHGRVLVTYDKRTMPQAFGRFVLAMPSAGVLIVPPKMSHRDAVEGLLLIWHFTEQEEWHNRIQYLQS
jgi:hypothetical protein